MSLWIEPAIIAVLFVWTAVLTYFTIKTYRLTRYKVGLGAEGKSFSHWSLVRFNPFSDTGGQHSFILTLLNAHRDGLIITSLHGRGVTRFYVKKVTSGQADQELSQEEKTALAQALKS